jgi:hypothetical protein
MSDITNLFQRVGPAADAEPSAETIDTDLERGRMALARDHRRRTIRRSMAATTTVAAAAVVALVAAQLHGSGASRHGTNAGHAPSVPSISTHDRTGATKAHRHAAIKLVAYTGKQLAGFTVDKVPQGWFLGGVNQYALTINPAGDTDTSPGDFEGKLTVLLASQEETSFPKDGTQVTVAGQPGVIWTDGGVQLGYTDSAGHRIDIQVPNKLGWSDDQIVAFAQGVHVTADAIAGHG